jgi:hypothetical protein
MRMKDEHIQKKLVELEAAILKESKGDVVSPDTKQTRLVESPEPSNNAASDLPTLRSQSDLNPVQKSDLQYFGGIGLILVGLFLLFNHVRVTSGYASLWGWNGDHIGYLMLPLLFGVGWVFYNAKSVWGWLISVVSLFMIVFSILSGLRIWFAPVSMIDLIIMLVPFAIGAAYVLKGIGGPQGVDEAIRKQIARRKN